MPSAKWQRAAPDTGSGNPLATREMSIPRLLRLIYIQIHTYMYMDICMCIYSYSKVIHTASKAAATDKLCEKDLLNQKPIRFHFNEQQAGWSFGGRGQVPSQFPVANNLPHSPLPPPACHVDVAYRQSKHSYLDSVYCRVLACPASVPPVAPFPCSRHHLPLQIYI